jgi:hypothetical protein
MLKVDENGNPIEYEEKEGEYHTMLADEGNTGSGTTGNTSDEQDKLDAEPSTPGDVDPVAPDQTEDLDKAVSDKDTDEIPYIATDSDLARYDTVKTLAENAEDSNTTENTNGKDNTVFYAVGSGVLGMTIGAALVYFLTKKH